MEIQKFTDKERIFLKAYTQGGYDGKLYAKRVYEAIPDRVEDAEYAKSIVYVLYYARLKGARHYFGFVVGNVKKDASGTLETFGTEDFLESYRNCIEVTEDWIGEKYVERPVRNPMGQDTMEEKIQSIHCAFQGYVRKARARVETKTPVRAALSSLLWARFEEKGKIADYVFPLVYEIRDIVNEKERAAEDKLIDEIEPLFTTEKEMKDFIRNMTETG